MYIVVLLLRDPGTSVVTPRCSGTTGLRSERLQPSRLIPHFALHNNFFDLQQALVRLRLSYCDAIYTRATWRSKPGLSARHPTLPALFSSDPGVRPS